VGATTIFIRRRDGRIEVRLNDRGRDFVRRQFERLMAVDGEADHAWRSVVYQPIDPADDVDDPLWVLERERVASSNTELALVTVDEEFLNNAEAWAWLCSLQHVLRGISLEQRLFSDDDVAARSDDELNDVRVLQLLLFELADVIES